MLDKFQRKEDWIARPGRLAGDDDAGDLLSALSRPRPAPCPRAAGAWTCRVTCSATSRRTTRRACRSSACTSSSASARPKRRSSTASYWLDAGAEIFASVGLDVEAGARQRPVLRPRRQGEEGDAARAGPQVRVRDPDLLDREADRDRLVQLPPRPLRRGLRHPHRDGDVAHSACVGFGLERIALALFKTHGLDAARWPREVKRDVLALMTQQIARARPGTYRRHAIHGEDRIWAETNCYVDLWIELLHALGLRARRRCCPSRSPSTSRATSGRSSSPRTPT